MATIVESPKVLSREASMLIATDRVHGTDVWDRAGDKIGTIEKLMIDKRSGQVAYVILTSGGFLALGQSYHPVPWSMFRYDEAFDGYSVAIDKQLLDGAPSYRPDTAPTFDEAYGNRVTEYYESRPPALCV
jgi:sporulation protein YlmC with PRC-barrel domain